MNKKLKVIASAMLLTVAAASQAQAKDTNTFTNVVEAININLIVYEQGATNSAGTDVARDVHQLNNATILGELAVLNPGTNFAHAQLVQFRSYFTNNQYLITVVDSNILSFGVAETNYVYDTPANLTPALALSNWAWTNFGMTNFTATNAANGNPVTSSNIVWVSGVTGPTEVFTHDQGSMGILVDKTFTPLTSYLSATNWYDTGDSQFLDLFNDNSPSIKSGPGVALLTTNGMFKAGATGISYATGMAFMVATNNMGTNLNLSFDGLEKKTVVIDTLHSTNQADIYSYAWTVAGTALIGGTLTTNASEFQSGMGYYYVGAYTTTNNGGTSTFYYVTNAMPAVIQGTINATPLPNKPEGGPVGFGTDQSPNGNNDK